MEKRIMLSAIEDVKKFVKLAMPAPFDIELHSGKYTVDGKSIMGIFSLDLSMPVTVTVPESPEAAAFLNRIAFLAARD